METHQSYEHFEQLTIDELAVVLTPNRRGVPVFPFVGPEGQQEEAGVLVGSIETYQAFIKKRGIPEDRFVAQPLCPDKILAFAEHVKTRGVKLRIVFLEDDGSISSIGLDQTALTLVEKV